MGVLLPVPFPDKVTAHFFLFFGIISIGSHSVEMPSGKTSRGSPGTVISSLWTDIPDVAIISAADLSALLDVIPTSSKLFLNR